MAKNDHGIKNYLTGVKIYKMTGETEIKQITQSDYAVSTRREWLLGEYIAGRTPQSLYAEYRKTYKLSKAMFDKDVQACRQEINYNLKDRVDDIMNDQLTVLYRLIDDCQKDMDRNSLLKALKLINDLIGIVNRTSKTTKPAISVNFNTQNNNLFANVTDEDLNAMIIELKEQNESVSK